MANTCLTILFKDMDAAKVLGSRGNAGHRKWYVPDGRELTPIPTWLSYFCIVLTGIRLRPYDDVRNLCSGI